MDRTLEARIRERAYEIWIEQGRPQGRDGEHWYRAEREIAALTAPVPEVIEVPPESPAPRRRTAARKPRGGEAVTAAESSVGAASPKAPRRRKAKSAEAPAADGGAPATRKTRARKDTTPAA